METIYFEGTLSCKAVIECHPDQARVLYVDEKKRTRDFGWIIRRAKSADIPVIACTRSRLDELTGSRSHGGMVLESLPLSFSELESTLPLTGFGCYVEGVEDPHNLGSVCRTLYAAGCSRLILPRREWTAVQPVIMRASAGTFARLDIVMTGSDEELCSWLKGQSIPLICAERKEARPLFGFQWPESFCLCLGGALRGLGRTILASSSCNLYIPYLSDMKAALDTPSAAAVFAFSYAGGQYEAEHQ